MMVPKTGLQAKPSYAHLQMDDQTRYTKRSKKAHLFQYRRHF